MIQPLTNVLLLLVKSLIYTHPSQINCCCLFVKSLCNCLCTITPLSLNCCHSGDIFTSSISIMSFNLNEIILKIIEFLPAILPLFTLIHTQRWLFYLYLTIPNTKHVFFLCQWPYLIQMIFPYSRKHNDPKRHLLWPLLNSKLK